MGCRLFITTNWGGSPPRVHTLPEDFDTDSRALDRAEELINREDKRRQKDPHQGPALTDLRLECEDGLTIDYAAIRRMAPRASRD